MTDQRSYRIDSGQRRAGTGSKRGSGVEVSACPPPNSAALRVRAALRARANRRAVVNSSYTSVPVDNPKSSTPQTQQAFPANEPAARSGKVDRGEPAQYSDEPAQYAERLEQMLLEGHATNLISKLQAWADDLDAREAALNARAAVQEHRERTFRIQRRDAMAEIEEQNRRLEASQRKIDRLRDQIQEQAKRLAFQNS